MGERADLRDVGEKMEKMERRRGEGIRNNLRFDYARMIWGSQAVSRQGEITTQSTA
jgi:hypothetical protein